MRDPEETGDTAPRRAQEAAADALQEPCGQSAGRMFFTSSSVGWYLVQSRYTYSTITPFPPSFLVLPTYAPMVDWLSWARELILPKGVSTCRPLKGATSFSVSVLPAFFPPAAIE